MSTGLFSRLFARTARALPSQCVVCTGWCYDTVCSACVARFAPARARCLTCALALPGAAKQCGVCLQHGSALDACHAAVDYAYPWDGVLAQLKFNGQSRSGAVSGADPAVARCLAAIMAQRSPITQALAQADWAVPVPLAGLRLQERGFNQALQITKYLLAPGDLAKPAARALLRTDLLVRTRDTAAQVGLGRAERQLNMLNAFAVEPAFVAQVQGARLVLVDDVTTTTSTLSAAAAALRRAGAAHVTGVVFARTPGSAIAPAAFS